MKKTFDSFLDEIQNTDVNKKRYSGTLNQPFVLNTPQPRMGDFKQLEYSEKHPSAAQTIKPEYDISRPMTGQTPRIGVSSMQPRMGDFKKMEYQQASLPSLPKPFQNFTDPSRNTRTQTQNRRDGLISLPMFPQKPKYTPTKSNIPVDLLTDDSALTPQQRLAKYTRLAEVGNTLSAAERNRLAKQGQQALNDIARQQITLPFLRPDIGGTVTQEEIAQAIALRDRLAQMTRGGAAATGFVDAVSFGMLRHNPIGAKTPMLNPDLSIDETRSYGDYLRQTTDEAQQAQPLAYGMGSFAGEGAKYATLAPAIEGLPVVGKAVSAAGKGIAGATGGRISADTAARLVAGRITDLPLDIIRAAQESDNLPDFAKNLGIDTALGLGTDIGLETIGKLWRMARGATVSGIDNAAKGMEIPDMGTLDASRTPTAGAGIATLSDGRRVAADAAPDFYIGLRGVSPDAEPVMKIPMQRLPDTPALPAPRDGITPFGVDAAGTSFTYPINAVSGGRPQSLIEPVLQPTANRELIELPMFRSGQNGGAIKIEPAARSSSEISGGHLVNANAGSNGNLRLASASGLQSPGVNADSDSIFSVPQAGAKINGSSLVSERQPGIKLNDTTNLVRYRKQIDNAFKGELPTGADIVLGETPEILRRYGADGKNLHMSQSTARKIAYPTGYLGLEHGHNLGLSVLKNLPEQLENPIAILKNPQPNSAGLDSIIVITKWYDDNGKPIVTPIHLNKQGAVEIQNEIASTFGADYIDRLLGPKNKNVLYTKKNEDIQQLLSTGVSYPKAMADDIFADTIIPPGRDNINSSPPISKVYTDADAPLVRGKVQGDSTVIGLTDADAPPAPKKVNTAAKNPREISVVKEFLNEVDAPELPVANPDAEAVARMTGKGVGYNKDFARNFDAASGKDPKVRAWLHDNVEKPFLEAKAGYSKAVRDKLNTYKKQMDALGIKAKSKESAAIQWLGEGVRIDKYGDPHEFTLTMLKEEFPDSWQRIVQGEKISRQLYDEYIGLINQSLERIYPDAPAKALDRSDRLLDAIHYTQSRIDELLDDLAGEIDLLEQGKIKDEIARLKRKIQLDSGAFNQLQEDISNGNYLRNKRLLPRKDYFHHFQEMEEGLSSLKNILSTPADIDPKLVGVSDYTEPKSKWAGYMQRRTGGRTYKADTVGGLMRYIPQAEYKIHIDPVIANNRGVIKYLVEQTENSRHANRLIEWLTHWTNDMAGKSNFIDRPVQMLVGRKAMKVVEWLSNRVKSNAVLGNVRSAVSQVFNIPNAAGYIKNPKNLAVGATDWTKGLYGDKKINALLDSSPFLTERYLDKAINQFDSSLLSAPRKFAEWLLTVGDEQSTKFIWLSAYDQAKSRGIKDAIAYADDITRRSVAGRGVGEMPIAQRSRVVQLLAPFQVEVTNAFNVLREKVSEKDALGLAAIFATSWLMNEAITKSTTGDDVGYNPIGANIDLYHELKDSDKPMGEKARFVAGRNAGEILSNMPFGSYIANSVPEQYRTQIFGDSDPSRFGIGNIGINTITEPVLQLAAGQRPDIGGAAANVLLPFGGRQLERSLNAAADMDLLPRLDGLDSGAEDMPASYTASGRLRFPIDTSAPWNVTRGLLFGSFATNEGRAYLDSGARPLSDKATGHIKEAFRRGLSPQEFLEVSDRLKQIEPIKDEFGKVIVSAADQKRDLLKDWELPAEHKAWLDEALIGELKQPRDYSSTESYILSGLTETQQKGFRELNRGITENQRYTAEEYAAAVAAVRGIKKKEDQLTALYRLGYRYPENEKLYNAIHYKERKK